MTCLARDANEYGRIGEVVWQSGRFRAAVWSVVFLALSVPVLAMAEDDKLSVMELPALEGSDGPQVAVKWSGELPVMLEVGMDTGEGGFAVTVQAGVLTEPMTLLPHPVPDDGEDVSWRVLGMRGQTLAKTQSNSSSFGWQPDFIKPGLDGFVEAATIYDGDLVVAGGFQAAGEVVVNGIARWDGSEWSSLDSPLGSNGGVAALTVYNGELIAGGVAGQARIWRWNGSQWTILSGLSSSVGSSFVNALTVHNGELIAGGRFETADGVAANNIARWDGSQWAGLSGSSGTGTNDDVRVLNVYDGELIAGGHFTTAGGLTVNRIARWNGSQWASLDGPAGTGMDAGAVIALTVYDTELIAGGAFSTAGGVTANHIARWDGNQWAALSGPSGAGMDNSVDTLTVYNGELIAGGSFTSAGGVTANRVARWDGSQWAALSGPMGTGMDNRLGALTVYDSELIAGGHFTSAGGVTASHIARWNGSQWASLGPDAFSGTRLDDQVRAMTVYDGELIAGGDFNTAGGVTVNRIARWNGSQWDVLAGPSGTGMNGRVLALSVYDGELIAGGDFNTAGGVTVNRIARWNGSQWAALDGPVGTGMDSSVLALTVHGGDLVAGGWFTEAGGVTVNRIARWDGSEWAAFSGPSGTGTDNVVHALTVYDGKLVAGGRFTQAGGVTVINIAHWDGANWSALTGPSGTGVNNWVWALTVYDAELIAGGQFTSAGGLTVNRVARWNGSQWAALSGPSGTGMNWTVTALSVYNGELIAGGLFGSAGGLWVNNIARWNGNQWAALTGPSGTGMNSTVRAQTVYNGDLYAAGNFTVAGGIASGRIGRYVSPYNIGGSVSGLAGSGLVLQNNGGDDLLITGNGPFEFDTALPDGSDYDVTAAVQPTNLSQTCTIANGTGSLTGADVTNVEVTCVTDTFTVGGTVSGLEGAGLVLQNNASDDLAISANNAFTFTTSLEDGSNYDVTVLTQPSDPSQTCAVNNGAGKLAGTDVTNVDVLCTTDSYTVTTTATNGTITSSIDPMVEWGQTTTVTGQANSNHYFASVGGCDGTQQSNTDQGITGFSYETGSLEADCIVSAEFSIRTYSMSSTVGSGQGTIDVLSPVVEHGSDADFEVIPDSGWLLQSFTGDTCAPTDNGDGTWTATAISTDCEVTAEFIEDTTSVLIPSMNSAIVGMPVTYTLQVTGTASAPADGQIELVSDLDGVICSISEASSTNAETATFSCQHTWTESGEHQLTATFVDSATHDDSDAQFQQRIVDSEKVFQDRFQSE